jgi:O-antigen/teichoic acid export membrane protein
MARFSVFIMLGGIASQTMIQAPPAILAGYKTTAEVAVFAIPNTVFLQLGTIVGTAGMAFLPFVSAAAVEADHTPIRAIYAANLRLTVLVLAPVLAFIGVFAHPLLTAWISAHFAATATAPLRLLMGAALMLALSGAPNDLARAFGKASLVTLYTVLASCACVAASLLAVPAHGPAGAALGLLTGLTLVTVPFLFLDARWLIELSPRTLARALSGPCAGALLVLALYVAGLLISDSFLSAIVTGAVATPIYVAVAARVLLDSREREVLSTMLRRVRRTAPAPDDGTAINVPMGTTTLATAELTSAADPDLRS